MYGSILEYGRKHLRVLLVYRGKGVILFNVEQGQGPSKGIEAAKLSLLVEVGDHLGGAYLIVVDTVLLDVDEGVGHKVRLLHSVVPYHHIDTVGYVLMIFLVPYLRLTIESGQRVQVAVAQGIAGDLHCSTVDLDLAHCAHKADFGRVLRRRKAVRSHGKAVRRNGKAVRRHFQFSKFGDIFGLSADLGGPYRHIFGLGSDGRHPNGSRCLDDRLLDGNDIGSDGIGSFYGINN